MLRWSGFSPKVKWPYRILVTSKRETGNPKGKRNANANRPRRAPDDASTKLQEPQQLQAQESYSERIPSERTRILIRRSREKNKRKFEIQAIWIGILFTLIFTRILLFFSQTKQKIKKIFIDFFHLIQFFKKKKTLKSKTWFLRWVSTRVWGAMWCRSLQKKSQKAILWTEKRPAQCCSESSIRKVLFKKKSCYQSAPFWR